MLPSAPQSDVISSPPTSAPRTPHHPPPLPTPTRTPRPPTPPPRIPSRLSPVVQPLPQPVHLPKPFVWTTHPHSHLIPPTPTIAMPISIPSRTMDMREMEVGITVPCRSMAQRI
ncbi:hypothetical protein BofuT4_P113020.1 [Botrytis cinerea T4]|uniref:Uncharacterized protein n=1 Tax=Botryotinia fuckeliana (strain T4) TaxID=999810 RepID=G2Y5Q2_BOTF4|nr:hypothetical protein BofuT4_P113020.1 [Botrytis cinerea T4]